MMLVVTDEDRECVRNIHKNVRSFELQWFPQSSMSTMDVNNKHHFLLNTCSRVPYTSAEAEMLPSPQQQAVQHKMF